MHGVMRGVVSGSWFRFIGIYRAWDIVTEKQMEEDGQLLRNWDCVGPP